MTTSNEEPEGVTIPDMAKVIERYCELISMRMKEVYSHELPNDEATTLFNDVHTYCKQMEKIAKNAEYWLQHIAGYTLKQSQTPED